MMAYLTALFFQTTTGSAIFGVVALLWVLSEIVVGGIIPRLRRHGAPIRFEDKGSRPLIALSMILALVIAFLFAASGIASLPSWSFYVGISLMIAGIVLRQWSIAVLGRYFSPGNRHSRGSGGGGSRAISPSASSLLHRPAHNLHRTGIRDTVVGGCARAHSLLRSSLRLSDSRGGGGFNIEAGRRIRRVRKENEEAYSVHFFEHFTHLFPFCMTNPKRKSISAGIRVAVFFLLAA